MLSVRPGAVRALVLFALFRPRSLPCSSVAQTTSAAITGTVVDVEEDGAWREAMSTNANETRAVTRRAAHFRSPTSRPEGTPSDRV